VTRAGDPRDVAAFTAPLIGLPVSHVWQGHGTALFIEFGTLRPTLRSDGTPGHPTGEMGLMLGWTWRIEGKRSVLCGSWGHERTWPRAFAAMRRATVNGATLQGRVPEIDIALSNGIHVATFAAEGGDPGWALFARDAAGTRTLAVRAGVPRVSFAPRGS
jgi:hypothetical protein